MVAVHARRSCGGLAGGCLNDVPSSEGRRREVVSVGRVVDIKPKLARAEWL